MKSHTALFSAVFCALFIGGTAQAATVILSYNQTGCGLQAAACFELPGVTGSDLTGTGSGALAPGLYRPFTDSVGTKFSFSMAGFSGHVDTLTFGEYNNDCQTGSSFYSCSDGTTWTVEQSLNGGTFTPVSTFGSGGPAFVEQLFSVTVDADLIATDTIAFNLVVTGIDPGSVVSSALAFDNINLNGTENAPEPASLILFGSGIACLGCFGRRRAA